MTEAKRKITAKAKLDSMNPQGNLTLLMFGPDYADDRNQEWAAATPHFQVSMTVRADVATRFEPGAYTVTFEKTED